ncbi:MAG: hypothetical protein K0Q71_1922 [Thermomicrobiales bacterium]|jgi:hypothetical protein|nr:hypothetical protein [Thermomicrobiales bacterium]
MALQIDAPETIRLVEELARRTGNSAETVVEIAVRAEFDRLQESKEEAQLRAEIYTLVKELGALFRKTPDLVTAPAEPLLAR